MAAVAAGAGGSGVAHADAGLFLPRPPASLTAPPPGFRLNATAAVAVAGRQPAVRRAAAAGALVARPFVLGDHFWLVRFFRGTAKQAEVEIDGRNGRVEWTAAGRQLDWPPIVHGEHGPAVRRLHWALLCAAVLFLLPFVEVRRLLRMRHLDLLAILAFGASFVLADAGHVYAATPLMYPPLLYLLGRGLWLASGRSRASGDGFWTWVSPRTLSFALIALLIARYVYVAVDGRVNDVGYASLFGADSIVHGYPLYDSSPASGHLDAYGPLNYVAYVPFVLLFPFHNLAQSSAGGAQAAAIVFDLGTVAALYALGRRLAGNGAGLVLAWGFAACPWTLFVLARATNDGLIALVLTLALLGLSSPLLRGIAIGVGAAAKFGPLALAPLFARVGRERGARPVAVSAAAVVVILIVSVLAFLPDGGLREFYDSTLGFQLSRSSPFSIWGLHPGWEPLRPVVSALAILLAAGALFWPRERTTPRIAAAGLAILVITQLSAIHWYWFYIPWFLPYALVAFFSTSYAGSVRNSGSSSASAVAANSS